MTKRWTIFYSIRLHLASSVRQKFFRNLSALKYPQNFFLKFSLWKHFYLNREQHLFRVKTLEEIFLNNIFTQSLSTNCEKPNHSILTQILMEAWYGLVRPAKNPLRFGVCKDFCSFHFLHVTFKNRKGWPNKKIDPQRKTFMMSGRKRPTRLTI